MPGFSRMEQQRLARIVLAHRGKLGKMQDAGLEGSDWTLVFALRIAALVLRNRTDARFPMLRVAGDKSRLQHRPAASLAGGESARRGRARDRDRALGGGRPALHGQQPVGKEGRAAARLEQVRREHRAHHDLRLGVALAVRQPPQPALLHATTRLPRRRAAPPPRVPRSGWWPTTTTAPLCAGQPAASRMSDGAAPGASRSEIL